LATASDVPELAAVVERAGYQATRSELIASFDAQMHAACQQAGERLSTLAALVHRLVPGVRLM